MNNIKKNVLLSATALGLVFAFNANAEIKVQAGDTAIDDAVLEIVRDDANIINHEPDASKYEYKNPNGTKDTLETSWEASDYKATSSADGETVQAKDANLSYNSDEKGVSDYQYYANYTDNGHVTQGWLDGNVDVAEVTDIFTSSYQAGSKEVTASSNKTGAIDIADYYYDHGQDHYTISYDDETQEYTLYKNGDPHEDADLMASIVSGYEGDVASLAALQDTLKGYYDTNVANHDAVAGVVDADNNTIDTLHDNEAEWARQVAKYGQDQAEYAKYPGSLSKTIDTKAYDAIDEVVGHANTAGEGEESTATGLFKAVDDETTRATAAEGTLQDNIDAEASRATAAEGVLQDNIDAEVIRATAAEGTLQDNIDAEVTRATGVENAINAKIGEGFDAENTVAKAIEEEVNRATGVEGDMANLEATYEGNLAAKGSTIAQHLAAVDARMGKIHGLFDGSKVNSTTVESTTGAGSNLAEGTTIEDHLVSLDNAIGDRTNLGSKNTAINDGVKTSVAAGLKAAGDAIGDVDFSETKYALGATDVSSAIRQLDSSMAENQARNEARFDAIDHRISSLRNEMREGLAATAALAGLVPLDNTYKSQLSMAMGGYENKQAVALGGFHYLKDNIILNAGVSYGGSHSTAYKVGVTFGF